MSKTFPYSLFFICIKTAKHLAVAKGEKAQRDTGKTPYLIFPEHYQQSFFYYPSLINEKKRLLRFKTTELFCL